MKRRLANSVQQLDRALTELEDRGLIGWDREANRYDAHPIVRGVVWQLTNAVDQRTVYAALDAHFEPMAVPNEDEVETLADLAPAIERYHTLVGLGRYDDAVDLFYAKLSLATHYRLAAHRERIGWLERLFPNSPAELPALTKASDQAYTLSTLAISYRFSGQPGLAEPLQRRVLEISGPSNDLKNHIVGAISLGETLCEIGALREAATFSQRSLFLARTSKDLFRKSASLQALGRISYVTGHYTISRIALSRGVNLSKKQDNRQLECTIISHLAEVMFFLGNFVEASALADRAWDLAAVKRNERDFIRSALLQGRVALRRERPAHAEERLHNALARARAANVIELELPILIAIAELEFQRDHLAEARSRLDDVWDAAERGPYPLQQADAFNVLADIGLAEGNKPAAIDAAAKAYKAAWCDGPPYAYHWGLQKAKAHLAALGAPEPDMPPFDESKFEPLPEVEINPKDEYWIDPDKLE